MTKYTEEQRQFIKENNSLKTSRELADMFNKKFGTSITCKNIKYFRQNNRLNSGLTGRFEKGHVPANKGKKWNDYVSKEGQLNSLKTTFKKGHVPANHKPVGYERINVDGYIEIKVKEPNVFRLKHRVVYEQHHGKIPSDMNVIFADGNKLNLDIDNLILVKKSELLIMNKRGLIKSNKELTKSGHIIAKVIEKTNELRKT